MSELHFYGFPVLVAAAIQFVIAALWFGIVFKKRWTVLVGHSGEAKPGRVAFEMITAYVLSVALAAVLAVVIHASGALLWGGAPSFRAGAAIAVLCWIGFIAGPMLTQSIFEQRPVNLFAINAGYWIVALAISGGVLAVMIH